MKRDAKIKTVSYVHVGDQLVRFDDLTDDQRQRAATELKFRYLSELYRGQAVFALKEDAQNVT